MLRTGWLILLLIIAAVGVQAQDAGQDAGQVTGQTAGLEPHTLTFEGLERTYLLHVPDGLDTPAPLVLALHGRFGSGAHMATLTDFNTIADAEGFIVAYPDGVNGEWNYVRGIRGYPKAQDDTAFLIALADQIASEYPVDRARVYLTGFSNGGFMAQRVACEQRTAFAAYASVAAAGFGGMGDVCAEPSDTGAPMLLINGTADTNVPWEGTGVTRGDRTVYVTYPVPETLALWAEFNQCVSSAETSDVPVSGTSPGTSVRVLTVNCPNDAPVVLYMVLGGGHNWPGQNDENPAYGRVNRDIDASAEIWRFFAGQARQPQDTAPEATPEAASTATPEAEAG